MRCPKRVLDRSADREAVLQAITGNVEVALVPRQDAGKEQGLGPLRAGWRRPLPGERVIEPPAPLRVQAAEESVPAEGAGQVERCVRFAGDRESPLQSGTNVVLLGIDPLQP